jgi:hypothetical protein
MIDIHSQMPGIPGILSNLHPKAFIMNGLFYGSIEGFLQGLRCKDPVRQQEIFRLVGIQAKRTGYENPIKNNTLYYKGLPFDRHSDYYQKLLDKAFMCCFVQNDIFQKALYDSVGHELAHSIGKTDPNDTILTNQEFLSRLDKIRTKHFLFLENKFWKMT